MEMLIELLIEILFESILKSIFNKKIPKVIRAVVALVVFSLYLLIILSLAAIAINIFKPTLLFILVSAFLMVVSLILTVAMYKYIKENYSRF